MGYTHYWTFVPSKIKAKEWRKAVNECREIALQASKTTRVTHPDKDTLFIDTTEGSGETMSIPVTKAAILRSERFSLSKRRGGFCKTNVLPYDTVVVACLSRLAQAGLEVSSDGDPEDWDYGACFAGCVLHRKVPNPLRQ